MFSKSSLYKYLAVVAIVLLVLISFLLAQLTIVFVLRSMLEMSLLSQSVAESTILQFFVAFLSYGLTFGFIVGLYQILNGPIKNKKVVLGVKKVPKYTDIGYVVLGYITYFGLNIVVLTVISMLLPGFNINEEQDIGFEQVNSFVEYTMVFIALVVLAPLVEEVLFRGFMFTKIREKVSFWPTAIVVSLVFGLVHLQWNVGIDVFVLSLVLCFVREKTGAIWAGVGIHMLKNLLAFMIVFLGIM